MAEAEPSTPKVDPLAGTVLANRFRLLELIDRGGMGKVYRAEQIALGRTCAVKILDVVDKTGEFETRFFLEASLSAKLTHPNTVRIFDYGVTDDGVYYFAMELLEGRSLDRLIRDEAPVAPLRAIRIIREICGALAEAHDQGMVHRDIKPANVYLTRHGDDGDFAKVLDFGLVKDLALDSGVSHAGKVLGSPLFMAPEQVEGGEIDNRTDLYSVGLLLYLLLSGKMPFKATTSLAVMMQRMHATPPPFSAYGLDAPVPELLEWVVRRAVEREPDDRFASMRELSRALKICERELRGELPPITLGLSAGRLVLPDGVEELEPQTSDSLYLPGGLTADTDRSLFQSMARPAPIAAGAALLVVVGGGILVGIIAIIAILVLGVPTEASPEPVPVVAAPSTAVPGPRRVELVTDPPGAEVYRDGAVIGSTPLPIELDPGRELTLEVRLVGHTTKTVLVDGSVPEITLGLDPVSKPAAPRTPPVASPPEPRREAGNEIRDPWADEP